MKAPKRRDPRDDAVNLANDTRAVLGLAPYRLPSAIVAEMEEEEPPPRLPPHVRVLPSGDRILTTCRPPRWWRRWCDGIVYEDQWRCGECGQAWVWRYHWHKVLRFGSDKDFGLSDVP